MTSRDLTQANIEKLAELFPSVVTEALDADGNPAQAIDSARGGDEGEATRRLATALARCDEAKAPAERLPRPAPTTVAPALRPNSVRPGSAACSRPILT